MRLLAALAFPFALAAQGAPAPAGTAATPPAKPAQQVMMEERRFDEARAVVQALLAKDKNDANALYWMGRIADAQDKSGEAVDWYEKAVKREPNNALYHFWLGSALGDEAQKANKLRQPFLARRVKSEFEKSSQLDPKLLEPRMGLVDFYSIAPGIMGGSMDKAKEQANEIVKLNPMRGHIQLGRLALRQKDSTTAEKEYRAAIAASPDSSPGYYTLAGYYRGRKRWPEALAVYDDLMKAKPDEVHVYANWAIVAVQGGLEKQFERAEREFTHWVDHAPKETTQITQSVVRYWRAQLYQKTDRQELAKAEYAEALKFNPKNEDAKKALEALK